MTSAPVKDVNSLMNFVGGKTVTKTGSMTQRGSFGDVMSKTQGNGLDSRSRAATGRETQKAPRADAARSSKETLKPRESVRKPEDAVKPENVAESMTDEQAKTLEEAGNEIVKEIAGEFEVSVEEVEEAMETLGLSVYALFDPSNLKQLVLQLEGGQDATALLTDESLFAKLQNVFDVVSDVKTRLAGELELMPEDLQTLIQELEKGFEQTDALEETTGNAVKIQADDAETVVQTVKKEAPQITVEVRTGDETVRMSADERGNIIGTVETIPSEAEEKASSKHEQKGDENSKGKSEDTLHTGELQMHASVQNRAETPEVSFEQTTAAFSEQTREIMDQIMDYMRIQLKPGMDHLEMQLHPESLGTVHIQLSSKGGEITAQFQVQNETVKAAIESQIVSLQESLKEQGVKVEAVQVTVENHGFESNLWQGQGREENASSRQNRKPSRRINLNGLNGLSGEETSEEDLLAAKIMEANGNTIDYTA